MLLEHHEQKMNDFLKGRVNHCQFPSKKQGETWKHYPNDVSLTKAIKYYQIKCYLLTYLQYNILAVLLTYNITYLQYYLLTYGCNPLPS